jgi:biotin carboxyl carrier protein
MEAGEVSWEPESTEIMRRYTIDVRGKTYTIDVQDMPGETYRVQVEGQEFDIRLVGGEDVSESLEMVAIGEVGTPEGKTVVVPISALAGVHTDTIGSPILSQHEGALGVLEDVVAPMPGVIHAVTVAVGDIIEHGQRMVVLEAMKMKNDLYAPRDGVVAELLVAVGDHVNSGDVLLRLFGK